MWSLTSRKQKHKTKYHSFVGERCGKGPFQTTNQEKEK